VTDTNTGDDVAGRPRVDLDGAPLRLADLPGIAGGCGVSPTAAGLARARESYELAVRLASERPLYGRSTGVGANRDAATQEAYGRPPTEASTDQSVQPPGGRTEATGPPTGPGGAPGGTDPAVRLLRSHAAGTGPLYEPATVRCALAIRANQLLAGGAGASPELATALAELASGPDGDLPLVHRHGGLGTGDLTALAEVGLTLLGERPRADGSTRHTLTLTRHEALPLMSSNAFGVAEAGRGWLALDQLSAAALTVSALSFVALRGNPEAIGPAVARATPFPGAARTAETVRGLVGSDLDEPQQIQDFFGLRTWPQSHGPLLDELVRLRQVVEAMTGAPSENPLFIDGTASHQGGFHATYLTLAVDGALLALTRSAEAVRSRLAHLLSGEVDELPRFLAGTEPGASGLLITEYVAGAALGRIRAAAGSPAGVLTAAGSLGVEDLAGMAPVATARFGGEGGVLEAYAELLATELVAAVRAVRLRGVVLRDRLGETLWLCDDLPAGLEDRDLAPDLELAQALLPRLATPPS
jgi:histidine ammonia-lyase